MTHTNEQERPPEFAQGSSAETQKATPHTGEQQFKIASGVALVPARRPFWRRYGWRYSAIKMNGK